MMYSQLHLPIEENKASLDNTFVRLSHGCTNPVNLTPTPNEFQVITQLYLTNCKDKMGRAYDEKVSQTMILTWFLWHKHKQKLSHCSNFKSQLRTYGIYSGGFVCCLNIRTRTSGPSVIHFWLLTHIVISVL